MSESVTECSRLITDAQLMTMVPREGNEDDAKLGIIPDGAVAIDKNGMIIAVGTTRELLEEFGSGIKLSADGKLVSPALIDSHTHSVWGGGALRADEWVIKASAASPDEAYQSITKIGGGAYRTINATRTASFEELEKDARRRLLFMLQHGVGTVEIKSGYGVDRETELKMLEVIAALRNELPLEIVATYLGAHFPPKNEEERREYLRMVAGEMLPHIAQTGLAERFDAFLEAVGFNVNELDPLFSKARELDLDLTLHTNQFTSEMGGIELAVRHRARSVDHLEAITPEEIQKLVGENIVAVLLPGCQDAVGGKNYPPARELIAQGIPVALATDLNPGSAPNPSLTHAMRLGMTQMGMTISEVWQAVTVHAARALNRARVFGTLEVGKEARIAIWDTGSPAEPLYGFPRNFVEGMVLGNQHLKREELAVLS